MSIIHYSVVKASEYYVGYFIACRELLFLRIFCYLYVTYMNA
jgi:hypothetical protein